MVDIKSLKLGINSPVEENEAKSPYFLDDEIVANVTAQQRSSVGLDCHAHNLADRTVSPQLFTNKETEIE